MHYGDWNDRMGGGYGWWILMTIMMVVFWGGLIWFAIMLIRRPNHMPHIFGAGLVTPPAKDKAARKTALEILDKRLARGEIELDDYRQRRQALQPPKE